MEITTAAVPSEGGHWYDRNGNMVELVPGANGNMVKPDIRHARKLGLLPGVTTVLKVQSAPGLVKWQVRQALMSALTLPRREGESLDDFMERADRDAQEQGNKARDKGTELHTALERAAQCKPFDEQWERHVQAVDTAMRLVGIDFRAGEAERSFAHPLGFGGKNDGHCKRQVALWDYKSKPRIEGKKLAYDEHVQQLTACAEGLMAGTTPRLLNVFVGVEDAKCVVHEWDDPLDCSRGWQMFQAALTLWQLKNRYNSAFSLQEIAA